MQFKVHLILKYFIFISFIIIVKYQDNFQQQILFLLKSNYFCLQNLNSFNKNLKKYEPVLNL